MSAPKQITPREKVSQSEITKALRGAAKAGFKVRSLERRADGFSLVFDEPQPLLVAPAAADQNEWDTVK